MNKKQILGLIAAGIFPVVALAAGEHDMKGHNMKGHDMKGHDMKEHDMSAMRMEPLPPALGKPGNPAQVDRTVEVTLDDNLRFTPASINVKPGETIRFFIKNTGKGPHQMVLGNAAFLKSHAEMTRSMPNMQHNAPNMIHLNPGQRGGIVWQFTQAGTVDFACTVPGHMESGMVGKVTVAQ